MLCDVVDAGVPGVSLFTLALNAGDAFASFAAPFVVGDGAYGASDALAPPSLPAAIAETSSEDPAADDAAAPRRSSALDERRL